MPSIRARFTALALGAAALVALAPAANAQPGKKPAKAHVGAPSKTPKSSRKHANSKVPAIKRKPTTAHPKKPAKASTDDGKKGSSHAVFDSDYESTAAYKYGSMSKDACFAELKSRSVSFDSVEEARGVLAPLRLTGPLNGVSYHTELPAKDRSKSPYEVFDCRLVLALYDFSAILTSRGIHEVYIFSSWRPPAKDWPADKEATRHPGALAVDIRVFKKDDPSSKESGGTSDLVVARDWTPERDQPSCGDDAKIGPDTDDARAIRGIYCSAAKARIFNSMLGPNYNKAHENHFHLEVTPNVKWRMVI